MGKNFLELKVKFTKIGNRVKYRLPVKMFCERMNNELPNSMTLNKTDGLITARLFRLKGLGDADKVFKNKKTIKKVIVSQFYDNCDKPKSI